MSRNAVNRSKEKSVLSDPHIPFIKFYRIAYIRQYLTEIGYGKLRENV